MPCPELYGEPMKIALILAIIAAAFYLLIRLNIRYRNQLGIMTKEERQAHEDDIKRDRQIW